MDEAGKHQPKSGANPFAFDRTDDDPERGRSGESARGQGLVHDIERGTPDWNCGQRRHQGSASPSGQRIAECQLSNPPAGPEKKKDSSKLPEQTRNTQAEVRDAHRSCNQVGKNCHLRMREEEGRVRGIESGIERLLYAGQIDLGVFDKRMIAMNEDRGGSEKQQKRDLSEVGSQLQRKVLD